MRALTRILSEVWSPEGIAASNDSLALSVHEVNSYADHK